MKTKTQVKTPRKVQTVAKAPPKIGIDKDESTRTHRAINWVVSIILITFAIWSISLNAEGRASLVQAVAIIAETDHKLTEIRSSIDVVKSLCQQTTVVVPTPTIDAIE